MGDAIEFLKFLVDIETREISILHVSFAAGVTLLLYFTMFFFHKYVQNEGVQFSFTDFAIKCGVAFVVEFCLIWIYGPKVFILAIIVGFITSLYIRNKLFSFVDQNIAADHDLKMRMELAELKNKFKNSPHYSILEVLLYYGYISSIQKETVEAENIFKTPDDMAKEFLSKPILTEDQLEEAIGIMNVIRREGKILTREEALLLIMRMHPSSNSDIFSDSVG